MDLVPALSALKMGIDLAYVALEARDDAKVKEAIGDISRRLADANMGALSMSETLRRIEAQLRESETKLLAAEARLRKRESYVLREVGPGVFAYAYQPAAGDSTPAHFQCQICFDGGIDSVMSLHGNGCFLSCRVSPGHMLQIKPLPQINTMAIGRRNNRI